jgi:hypothetical protein
MVYTVLEKEAPTTGFKPEDVEQIEGAVCVLHPMGGCMQETILHDEEDDTYLQRCKFTGYTWWVRREEP